MKNYKTIWDNLSTNFADAAFFVGCLSGEDEIRRNGQLTAAFLREVLQIQPTDRVLEIGCGVARIGHEIAPYCGEWHGADISGNMIEHARERTKDQPNIYLHELPESDLGIFNDGYFDKVYSTIVFMHLDKVEMFTYMREAYRVLAPGGKAYFDTYNIMAPEAWQEFVKIIELFPSGGRPGHVSQFSTPQEMEKFMQEAGFVDLQVDGTNLQLVVTVGNKPRQEDFERPTSALNSFGIASLEQKNEVDSVPADSILKVVDGQAILPHEEWLLINDHIAAKDAYITELENTLSSKNRHIATLEARVRKQDKLLRYPPVRAVLRLTRPGK